MIERVYDLYGNMTAVQCEGGECILNSFTKVGQPAIGWNIDSASFEVVGTIVWDGACHAQLTGWWDSKTLIGPRASITGIYLRGRRPEARTEDPTEGILDDVLKQVEEYG